ncbi:hypothetical protein AB0M43_23555 [Longispora sp. NPDC051575]|uniref:hypothetical protein n=1 Tax=Longispora sp. NPDC051575 TaxID=3154943 RepID=UPI003428FB12
MAFRRSGVALAVLVLGVGGPLVFVAVRGPASLIRFPACDHVPGLPARLGTDPVFTDPPQGATPVDGPHDWQPCERDGEPIGGRELTYSTTSSTEELTRHYERVARDTGWRLTPDSGIPLVRGERQDGERCLRLAVGTRRLPSGVAGRGYGVTVTFHRLGERSGCST